MTEAGAPFAHLVSDRDDNGRSSCAPVHVANPRGGSVNLSTGSDGPRRNAKAVGEENGKEARFPLATLVRIGIYFHRDCARRRASGDAVGGAVVRQPHDRPESAV